MFHEIKLICSNADPGSVLEREAAGLLGSLASQAGSRHSHVVVNATSKEDNRSTPESVFSCSTEMRTTGAQSSAVVSSFRQTTSPEIPELGQRPATHGGDRSKLPPLPSREQPASRPAQRPLRERA